MVIDRAVATARALVGTRFPEARAAWLAGSVVAGTATASSDLDVTVVLDGPPAPYRESIRYDGWPVELFVHTPASVADFLDRDVQRRRPTLARLVAGGVRLVESGLAADLERLCLDRLEAGPPPLSAQERDALRYGITDLLDDLADATDPPQRTAIATDLWRETAHLLLAGVGRWWGSGKWLARELQGLDRETGGRTGVRLDGGLLAAIHGEPSLLTEVADEVLAAHGGRLWEGYRLGG